MMILYWLLAVPTGLVAAILLLMSLLGQRLSAATPVWLSLLCALALLGMLAWTHRLGSVDGKPGLAATCVLLSWLAFAAVMLANGLLAQKVWN